MREPAATSSPAGLALSADAQAILTASQDLARQNGPSPWSPLYVLAAILERDVGLLHALQVDVPALRAELQAALASRVTLRAAAGVTLNRFLALAGEAAGAAHAAALEVDHLLQAAAGTATVAGILDTHGLPHAALSDRLHGARERAARSRQPLGAFPALAGAGRDLTELARLGDLDPLIGREPELHRLMQVLSRRLKNNPVLVGYSGVGKTAIVEGLAQRIAAGRVPASLQQRRIVALDLAMLVAGAGMRGQFEERLQAIMREVERARGAILLFIDEVHAIVGAGASEGGFDFAGLVKPALARGTLHLIGATTPDEYRRYIERDPALERRCSPIWVAEPSGAESVAILKGLAPRYEQYHGVRITDAAMHAAVRLSARYIGGRYLPDKAIDLIDEAAARLALDGDALPRATAASDGRRQPAGWSGSAQEPPVVTPGAIGALVSTVTGIPVSRVLEDEASRLLRLEELLRRRVVGQDNAVRALAAAVRRARAGFGDPRRPIGSFVFLGPSGVGKTELARALAEALFNDPDALIRLDMSEYMERHNVARLFGAPPGYVGYEDAGSLTEQVRRRPYRVILLDEIEKAHADVCNVLLQVLDAGRLTDGHGRVVDFSNCIVIMTSNLGTGDETTAGRLLKNADGNYDRDWLESRAGQALRETFQPEFRNRIDEVIVFEPLGRRELLQIVDLQLRPLRASLALEGLTLAVTRAARTALIEEGFSAAFGARPLSRAIQRRLVDLIVMHTLERGSAPGDTLVVGRSGDQYTLRSRPGVPPTAPPAAGLPAAATGGAEHVGSEATPPSAALAPASPSQTAHARRPAAQDALAYLI